MLGDAFIQCNTIGMMEKTFLRRMIELFHMIQENDDDFPDSLTEEITKVIGVFEVHPDHINEWDEMSEDKKLYFKNCMWVYDLPTD